MEYDKLDLIDAKAEKLLDNFQSDREIALHTNALYLIIFLFITLVCFLYVLDGYVFLAFSLALLVLIPYRMFVGSASARADSLALYNTFENEDNRAYIINKLKFLKALINLKRTRLISLRMVYMVCFPVFLYMISLLVIDRELDWQREWQLIGLSLAAGITFWYYFFAPGISELTAQKNELSQLIRDIASR